MQTSNQNQFIGNLVNSTGDAIVGAINSSAMNTQQGIYNNTLNAVQSQASTNLAMCQGFGGINSSIDRGIGALTTPMTRHYYKYDSRLFRNRAGLMAYIGLPESEYHKIKNKVIYI